MATQSGLGPVILTERKHPRSYWALYADQLARWERMTDKRARDFFSIGLLYDALGYRR